MAQTEDDGLSEEEKSLLEETLLVNKEVSFGYNGSREWAEDKCILDWTKPRSEEVVCRPG